MTNSALTSFGQPLLPDPSRISALMAEAVEVGWLTNGGPLISRLEAQLQPWFGGQTRLVSSGTMALMMALRLGGLPEGAEVITTPLTFAATVQAILWCGFRPVFADVEPTTLTLCPRAAEAAITSRTAAILPVHFLGQACDTDAFARLARDRGLWLVYDAAHVFGTTLAGQPIGLSGDASAFSLHATKLMHCGEGGAVVFPRGNTQTLSRMRNFGLEAGRMRAAGINAKIPEASAAMGLAVLELLDAEINARQKLRKDYDAALSGLEGVRLPKPLRGASPSLLYYALRLEPARRAILRAALAKRGVLARDYFPLLCGDGTMLPEASIITASGTPQAPRLAPEVLCLPFHGRVTPPQRDLIVDTIRNVLKEDQP